MVLHEKPDTTTSGLDREVLRKVTLRFMPLIGLCYIILYIDRLNIGVAALTMNSDLGISATAFGFAAGVYFISYTFCEPPSNYILTKVGVRVWIPRIMVTWGLVTIGMALVEGEVSLAVTRFLLGVAEAGFSPGMLYFVSRWFPNAHRGAAMSWVVTFICISGIGTPICTHILGMDGIAGLAGWRWLFILTGIPAIVLGFVCYRVLRDRPEQVTFLDERERGWLRARLDEEAARTPGHQRHSFVRGLVHPRVLVLICVFICVTFALNGYQLWMPQMFARFGLSTVEIGWLGALPPLLAIGPMLWWTRHSDRAKERAGHFAAAAGVAAIGFLAASALLDTPAAAIAAFCVAAIGMYAALAVFITIPSSFLTGAALAGGFGVINGMGNFGGYFGPQVTGLIKDATGSFAGAVASFGVAMAVGGAIVLVLKFASRPTATRAAQPEVAA
jgi:ACS family tartrate transporter-like MFS transporter